MLSETQIMNHINKLPLHSRLRLVQLTLDTLVDSPNSKLIAKIDENYQLTQQKGISGNRLLKFAGCIELGELQKMSQVIENEYAHF